jgi:hypothetical protein
MGYLGKVAARGVILQINSVPSFQRSDHIAFHRNPTHMTSFYRRIGPWVMAAAICGLGSAMAQSEPTLAQVYEAAQTGQLDKAQTMMQQVLVAHPNSAKAHFVQAELSARQGNLARAQEELTTAEKLAPGLPFAKPESVQQLRSQLKAKTNTGATASPSSLNSSNRAVASASPSASAPAASFPWGMALGLGAAAVALYFVMNRKKAATMPQTPTYGGGVVGGSGLSGPQSFGMGGSSPAPNGQPSYGQAPVAGSGMGGRIAGGLATGLAVGAGMLAANAIGKTLMGNDEHSNHHNGNGASGFEPSPQNADMGGQHFGVQDAGGWDDAGGGVDAGGDWDN